MTFRFDEAEHRYWLGDRELPSVTTIIKPATDYGPVPAKTLDFARDRGGAVHRACELFDLDDLVEDSLDPVVVPYLKAWKKFTLDFKPKWDAIEKPSYHPGLLYAGTPDRRGKIGRRHIVAEIKATARIEPAASLQLSGYDLIDGHDNSALMVVQLKPDGTYQAPVQRKDHSGFLSFLGVYNWLKRNQ